MKVTIVLEKREKAYFKSVEDFSPDMWQSILRRIAERTLARNGFVVSEVKVEA
jgi:hypothetical protein